MQMAVYPCWPPPNSVVMDVAFPVISSMTSSRVFRLGYPRIFETGAGGLGNPFVNASTVAPVNMMLFFLLVSHSC